MAFGLPDKTRPTLAKSDQNCGLQVQKTEKNPNLKNRDFFNIFQHDFFTKIIDNFDVEKIILGL